MPSLPVAFLLLFVLSASCRHRPAAEPLVSFAEGSTEQVLTRRLSSDLRNLVTAQEAFRADHQRYADRLDDFQGQYRTSTDVGIELLAVDAQGWVAVARHPDLPSVECRVAVGTPPSAPSWVTQLEAAVPRCVHARAATPASRAA
jgi:hypothetical protein